MIGSWNVLLNYNIIDYYWDVTLYGDDSIFDDGLIANSNDSNLTVTHSKLVSI